MTMNPMDILRPYQREAIDHLWKSWDAGMTRVPMVLATGLGKTKIFTRVVWRWLQENEQKRVLVIAHTDELIEQAAREMRAANPGTSVGIVKAGLNETHCRIIVSSRQTLLSVKRRSQLKRVGLIVIDEAHHAVRTNTYGIILDHFGAFASDDELLEHETRREAPKVLGLTATLSRGDKSKLSSVWQDKPIFTFRRDILFGIRNGFLLDVRGERVIVPDLNMSGVKKSGGDYQDASLAEELERTFAPQIVAEKYAAVARASGDDSDGTKLRQGIAFWPLVETAYHASAAFEAAGIPSAVIHGALPKEERRLLLKKFREGEITVVHNCMVLTEGFDAPWADVVVIGRPTCNGGLYQQMVGRVLRPDLTVEASKREKALILDVTGAGSRNDLRCLIDLSPERLAGREFEDGDSLLDLDDELQAELDALEEEHKGGSAPWLEEEIYHGPAETKTFDPLHRDRVWSQTPDGTFFMCAGSAEYVFLGESRYGDPGLWDVVWMTQKGALRVGSTEHVGLELEEALLWAEEEALQRGGHGTKSLTGRKSAWRREDPSQPQKDWAARTNTDITGMSKGEVSELMTNRFAAQRIDPFIRRMKGK